MWLVFKRPKRHVFMPNIAYFSSFKARNSSIFRASGANYGDSTNFAQVPREKPDIFYIFTITSAVQLVIRCKLPTLHLPKRNPSNSKH